MSDEQQKKLFALLHDSKTLALATLNKEQEPEASATPYIYNDNAFWIFVSQLSSHTDNLISRKKASLLITDVHSPTIFASTRATIQCDVAVETENKDAVLDIMTEQLGDTLNMLRQLPDFYLIRLTPKNGRFISGFGKAFTISFPNLVLKHVKT